MSGVNNWKCLGVTGRVDLDSLTVGGLPVVGGSGAGSVQQIGVTTAHGVSGVSNNDPVSPTLTFTLGAITPSTVSTTGLTLTGTAPVITAPFSTLGSRTLIQSSTTNGSTLLDLIPNGSALTSGMVMENSSTIGNNAFGIAAISGTQYQVASLNRGTGTLVPLNLGVQNAAILSVPAITVNTDNTVTLKTATNTVGALTVGTDLIVDGTSSLKNAVTVGDGSTVAGDFTVTGNGTTDSGHLKVMQNDGVTLGVELIGQSVGLPASWPGGTLNVYDTTGIATVVLQGGNNVTETGVLTVIGFGDGVTHNGALGFNGAINATGPTSAQIIVNTQNGNLVDLELQTANGGAVVLNCPVRPGIFAKASLPTGVIGDQIYVSDATRAVGTGAPCFYDGSNWIDVTTGVPVV